jgi:hypothetical protein
MPPTFPGVSQYAWSDCDAILVVFLDPRRRGVVAQWRWRRRDGTLGTGEEFFEENIFVTGRRCEEEFIEKAKALAERAIVADGAPREQAQQPAAPRRKLRKIV